jgi:hypothetical protein
VALVLSLVAAVEHQVTDGSDSGTPVDAGEGQDAGDGSDAGSQGDAGTTSDAGDGATGDAGSLPVDGGALPACPSFSPGARRITKLLFARELSGIAESRRNPGIFFVHNDSGGQAEVFAMASNGQRAATLTFTLPSGARALDWEDVAVGPGPQPSVSAIYVGDIGSNAVSRSTVVVYRVPEPSVSAPATLLTPPASISLPQVEAFTFSYPGSMRNAETLLVDPTSGDLYIVEKRGNGPSGVFRAAAPLSSSGVTMLQQVAVLAFFDALQNRPGSALQKRPTHGGAGAVWLRSVRRRARSARRPHACGALRAELTALSVPLVSAGEVGS